MHELSPAMTALATRLDVLREAAGRGRSLLEERRKECDRCAQVADEAAREFALQEAKAYFEAPNKIQLMRGKKEILTSQLKFQVILDTMAERSKAAEFKLMSESAVRAWKDARAQMRTVEREIEAITSAFHAYNQELKAEQTALTSGLQT